MSKPKLISYCPILYGAEYLKEAIQAVEPYVERIIMLYTPNPSYGHGTTMPCPESESELKEIALNASPKVEWMKIEAHQENQHRGFIYKIAESGGYDGILAFDADEIMGDLTDILPLCQASTKRYIGFGKYINFWKSFNHACYDGFTPIRYYNLHNTDAKGCDVVPAIVYHFSTAQRMEIMRYKLEIHGHKSEIRPGWLTDIYQRWEPGMEIPLGLHLVAHNCWPNAIDFDKNTLPLSLRNHPNFSKDVIV